MNFFYYMCLPVLALELRPSISPAEPSRAYLYNAAVDEWREISFSDPAVRATVPYWDRYDIGPRVAAYMAAYHRGPFSQPYNEDQNRAALVSLQRLKSAYQEQLARAKRKRLPDPDVVDVELLEPKLLSL